MQNLKYPIGRYQAKQSVSPRDVAPWIDEIQVLPDQLREAVENLTDEQLNTCYREEGWTLRQVVHHLADSHMNGYMRMKLALTEQNPTIKPYRQEVWAELPDSQRDISVSLDLLESLHERWTYLLKSLDQKQLERTYRHPKSGEIVLKSAIGLYAWHGKHHLAHITTLIKQKNWN